jgi:hypothetical protein
MIIKIKPVKILNIKRKSKRYSIKISDWSYFQHVSASTFAFRITFNHKGGFEAQLFRIGIDFRLSPCFECCVFPFGMFSGVWSLVSDVSEPSVCSIFIGECVRSVTAVVQSVVRDRLWNRISIPYFVPTRLWIWNRHSAPKRRQINFIRRRTSQKETYNISDRD